MLYQALVRNLLVILVICISYKAFLNIHLAIGVEEICSLDNRLAVAVTKIVCCKNIEVLVLYDLSVSINVVETSFMLYQAFVRNLFVILVICISYKAFLDVHLSGGVKVICSLDNRLAVAVTQIICIQNLEVLILYDLGISVNIIEISVNTDQAFVWNCLVVLVICISYKTFLDVHLSVGVKVVCSLNNRFAVAVAKIICGKNIEILVLYYLSVIVNIIESAVNTNKAIIRCKLFSININQIIHDKGILGKLAVGAEEILALCEDPVGVCVGNVYNRAAVGITCAVVVSAGVKEINIITDLLYAELGVSVNYIIYIAVICIQSVVLQAGFFCNSTVLAERIPFGYGSVGLFHKSCSCIGISIGSEVIPFAVDLAPGFVKIIRPEIISLSV